jgi:hypothetical protein
MMTASSAPRANAKRLKSSRPAAGEADLSFFRESIVDEIIMSP